MKKTTKRIPNRLRKRYLQKVREGKKDDRDLPCESEYLKGLKAVDKVDLRLSLPLPLYCTSASCRVALFYYLGFAYMMQQTMPRAQASKKLHEDLKVLRANCLKCEAFKEQNAHTAPRRNLHSRNRIVSR